MKRPQHLALSLSLAFLASAGCMTTPNRPFLGLSSLSVSEAKLERAGDQTDLKVDLDFGRRAQTVPGTWTRAVITLSNASLLPSNLSRDITQSSGSTITASAATFLNLRPGSGYSVSVTLYNGATQVASGTNSSVTLAAGANTINVTLTLAATPTPSPSPTPTPVPGGHSDVIAGGGASTPDNVLATSANLVGANGVAVDASGSVFVTSYDNGGVFMVPPIDGTYFGRAMTAGKIYRIAGGGSTTLNSTTRSAAPTSVAMHLTTSVTVDPTGNLFIVDCGDSTTASGVYVLPVRNTTLFGISMTANTLYAVAGSLLGSTALRYAGQPGINANGDMILTDQSQWQIYVLPNTTHGQYNMSLTQGVLKSFLPSGYSSTTELLTSVAVDASDSVYVTLRGYPNNASGVTDRVKKMATDGTWSTVGTYSTVNEIYSLAADPLGNVGVSNFNANLAISLIPLASGTYYGSNLSGGTGQRILSSLNFAAADAGQVAFDSARNLYVVNYTQGKVYKIAP